MTVDDAKKGFKLSRRTVILGGIAGTLLAANACILGWRQGFFKSKAGKPEPLELTFTGPFSPLQRIMMSPQSTPWVIVDRTKFTDEEFNSFQLVWSFNGKKSIDRKIHATITVTAIDGQTYVISDKDVAEHRITPANRVIGTAMGSTGSQLTCNYFLPRKPSEISKITASFVPVEPVLVP
jgi:hypothetical protein